MESVPLHRRAIESQEIDTRWGADDTDRTPKYAAELIALAPDVILASGTLSVTAVQRLTRTVPIVFASVLDPIGAGVVETLARPGGNHGLYAVRI